jgi:hypothetical protein
MASGKERVDRDELWGEGEARRGGGPDEDGVSSNCIGGGIFIGTASGGREHMAH